MSARPAILRDPPVTPLEAGRATGSGVGLGVAIAVGKGAGVGRTVGATVGRAIAVAGAGVAAGSEVGGRVGVPVGPDGIGVAALQANSSDATPSIPKFLALDSTRIPPVINPKPCPTSGFRNPCEPPLYTGAREHHRLKAIPVSGKTDGGALQKMAARLKRRAGQIRTGQSKDG